MFAFETGHMITAIILLNVRGTFGTFLRMPIDPALTSVYLSICTRQIVFFASHPVVPWTLMGETSEFLAIDALNSVIHCSTLIQLT
jgi:hypothetical protein